MIILFFRAYYFQFYVEVNWFRLSTIFFFFASPFAQRCLFNMFGVHKFKIAQNPKIMYENKIYTSEPQQRTINRCIYTCVNEIAQGLMEIETDSNISFSTQQCTTSMGMIRFLFFFLHTTYRLVGSQTDFKSSRKYDSAGIFTFLSNRIILLFHSIFLVDMFTRRSSARTFG